MNKMRLLFAFAVLACLLALRAPVHSKDKDMPDKEAVNKKKTLELLDKAKEEYRVFFKKPETTFEFWSAIKFEMDLGKFDLAALHLKLLLEKDAKQVDADLVKLEEAEGMTAFLRLLRAGFGVEVKDTPQSAWRINSIHQLRAQADRESDFLLATKRFAAVRVSVAAWSEHEPFQEEATKNVTILLDRLTKAVETHLSDATRIDKYLKQLDANTPEERGFAFYQLQRSGYRAVPYVVEALRTKKYGKAIVPKLKEMLIRMDPDSVPVYLEVFKPANDKDYADLDLRPMLLDLVKQRDDKRAIPYLWHMSASKKYPEFVRTKAKEVLASLLRVGVADLPPSRETLTQLAERYYQHKVSFPEGKGVKVWLWNGEAIQEPVELTRANAEEEFGMRYVREALDLDPSYQPAQVIMLSMILERAYKSKTDKILTDPQPLPPKMHDLLTKLDFDLALRILERGMEERQLPVVLPLVVALGERGDYRAGRPTTGEARGLVRGLYYPDRRVQYASMIAMLKMPPSTAPAPAADRIVELSRRFLASEAKSKALVVYTPVAQQQAVDKTVADLGFQAVRVATATLAIKSGKDSADFDLVIVHENKEFPFAYSQLRRDFDLGGLPMIVIVDKARERIVAKQLAANANVIVITSDQFQADAKLAPRSDPVVRTRIKSEDPVELKDVVDALVKNTLTAKLTPAERQQFAIESMAGLWRMARGELKGYDVTPALDVIEARLTNLEFAPIPIEILVNLPGKSMQMKLAGVVGDPKLDEKRLRLPAVMALNRHLQKNGVLLAKNQVADLKQAARDAPEGSEFRTQLNVTVSMLSRTTAAKTGADLLKFQPDVPAPPKEKKKEN